MRSGRDRAADLAHRVLGGAVAGFAGELAEATAIHLQQAIGLVEVVVVVGDGQDGLAGGLKLRQQLAVEQATEQRVLVGGPFVEDQDGPVFEDRGGNTVSRFYPA